MHCSSGITWIFRCHQAFLAYVKTRAKAFDLCCVTWKANDSCFALLFDLNKNHEGRAWAFLEVRAAILLANNRCIRSSDIDIVRTGGSQFPIPSREWVAFLSILQAARKNYTGKMNSQLGAQNIAAREAAALFQRYTGVAAELGLSLEESTAALAIIRERLVLKGRGRQGATRFRLRSKFGQYLRRFYFIHIGQLRFYSIHGPDGVGKSTTCAEINHIFARLPLRFQTFHHVTGWKRLDNGPNGVGRGKESETPAANVSMLHKILRAVYRILPGCIQKTYVLATSYDLYLRQLNRLCSKNSDQILLIDRYIYDLVTKNRLRGIGWNVVHWVFSGLARKPAIAFVLIDRPDRIRKRKQELSIVEIEGYMRELESWVKGHGTPTHVIDVEGKTPKEVAQQVTEKILMDCGAALMPLLRSASAQRSSP